MQHPPLNRQQQQTLQPLKLKTQPSQSSSSFSPSTWHPYKSIPHPKNLLKSIPQMSQTQINLNLIEINLTAYYNNDILEIINKKMKETGFYLKNRHLLENIINVNGREKQLNNKLKNICKKFDEIYVNGEQQGDMKLNEMKSENNQIEQISQNCMDDQISSQYQKNFLKQTKFKKYRANFISRRQDFILALNQISQKVFLLQQGKTQEEINDGKQKLFVEQIIQLNSKIDQQEEIKSQSSVDSNQLTAANSNNSFDTKNQQPDNSNTINFSTSRGYTFYFKNSFHQVNEIHLQKSSFIRTKNRTPLILDFNFSRFIYKNDDQLSHELIAMELIKYLNKVFGKEYIKEYQIIPEIKGALYEYVERSKTIAEVKKNGNKDISEYFQKVANGEKQSLSTQQIKLTNNTEQQLKAQQKLKKIKRQFAQSYAGYCIAEFLLQIKDRNNSNIMIQQTGTIFHIDLAFIFNSKPGGINFQSAPFKMPKQYIKFMDGFQSDIFKYFQSILIQLFTKISQSKQQFLYKLQILSSREKQIRCFGGFDFYKYKQEKLGYKLEKVKDFVQDLIDKSYDNWNTKKYDSYQWKVNKIPV